MVKNVLDASATDVVTPLLVSVRTTPVYVTLARTSRCPLGQLKPPAEGGPAERLATTRPFFGSNEPAAETSELTVSLLAACGWLPPPLMQAKTAVASAVRV